MSTNVLIVHAYSPRNSGDGLLVELTEELVAEAIAEANVQFIAVDASQFDDPRFLQWGYTADGRLPQRLEVTLAGMIRPSLKVRRAIAEADVIVAVGGGYLRASTMSEGAKSYLSHTAQLRAVAKSGRPSVYLSQSIGPYPILIRNVMRRLLSRIGEVHVRDDRSLREMGGDGRVRRMPDLAVLAMSALEPSSISPNPSFAAPAIVARDLARPGNYNAKLSDLARHGFEWAIQSTGGGNNDLPLTVRLSRNENPPSLKSVLGTRVKRIVVSTRLHGSMAALMAGCPTIHLGYERKSWGAFEDLGLDRYVLNARKCDADTVLSLIDEIGRDPDAYWARVRENLSSLSESRLHAITAIQEAARSKAAVTL